MTGRAGLLLQWLRRARSVVMASGEVRELRARLRADSSIAALLVARVGPHGYLVTQEVVQRRDGTLWRRARGWNDDVFCAWVPHPASGAVDLVVALAKLRAEAPHLRATLPEAADVGRLGELGLAVGDEVEWVVCRYPLVAEGPDGTLRDLLWRIASMPDAE